MVSIFLSPPRRRGRSIGTLGQGGGKNRNTHGGVRNITFFTHVMSENCAAVSGSAVFTHEKIRPETSHESGRTAK